jgi:hypothetical protein
MQGLDAVYLTYIPRFHKADVRQQLILHVEIPDSMKAEYKKARQANLTSSSCCLRQSRRLSTTFSKPTPSRRAFRMPQGEHYIINLLLIPQREPTMDCSVCIPSGPISITAVVKNRPLNSRWRDSLYPASFTPFYLYGTPSEPHVDHVLLRAPNAQIASDLITLKLEPALTAAQLARARVWTAPRPRCSHSLPHTRPCVRAHLSPLRYLRTQERLGRRDRARSRVCRRLRRECSN